MSSEMLMEALSCFQQVGFYPPYFLTGRDARKGKKMTEQIIKQPDGKFCIFSTIFQAIAVYDATELEIRAYFIEEAAKEIHRRMDERFSKLNKGEPAYHQFTMSYREAVEVTKENGFGGDIQFIEEEGA